MLRTVAAAIGPVKSNDLTRRLAIGGLDAVAAEWEIAVVYCLSLQGPISVQPSRDGVREPEVIYTTAQGTAVAVEVTALSDRGFHDRNPMRAFTRELIRITIKHAIHKIGAIHYVIGSKDSEDGPTLGVPTRQTMAAFFASDRFRAFIAAIKSAPATDRQLTFDTNGVHSRLQFIPGARFAGGTHAVFNLPVDLRRNAITARLKNKDSQLSDTGLKLPAVVFLCDADCYVLGRERTTNAAPSATEIIELFLNGRRTGLFPRERSRTRRINAVVTCSIKEDRSSRADSPRRRAITQSVRNRRDTYYSLTDRCLAEISGCIRHLPSIARMPVNALNENRFPAHYGGYRMSGSTKIEMSLLTLQQLLAGKISTEQFMRDHDRLVDQFRRATDSGKLISSMTIRECPDIDDDWVEIKLESAAPTHLFQAPDEAAE